MHGANNPALTAKLTLCSDSERLGGSDCCPKLNVNIWELNPQNKPWRFAMLKAWIVNPDTSSLHVEEKFQQWVEELRTDRYVTVPYHNW